MPGHEKVFVWLNQTMEKMDETSNLIICNQPGKMDFKKAVKDSTPSCWVENPTWGFYWSILLQRYTPQLVYFFYVTLSRITGRKLPHMEDDKQLERERKQLQLFILPLQRVTKQLQMFSFPLEWEDKQLKVDRWTMNIKQAQCSI